MKLLYFDLFLPFLLNQDYKSHGGTAVEWSNWFHGFNEIGLDIELLTWKGAKKYIKKEHNIKIRESYDSKKGTRILRVLYYRIPALYKAIKQSKATHVIQQNSSWIAGVLAMIAKIQNKKIVLRIASDSDVNPWASKIKLYNKIGYRIAINLSNIILCQNHKQKEILSKYNKNKSIHVLYNPIIVGNSIHIRKNKNNERKYVSWIGKFSTAKNLQLLAKIVLSLPKYKFKIIGQVTPNTPEMDLDCIDQLKKLDNVEIIDFLDRESIFNLLNSSKLLLNTSKYEGLSNTFLEALLVGTPIVTTLMVNPDNIISDNNFGIVASNDNEIIAGIESIVKNFDYEELYKRSNYFVKQNFESTMQAQKFISLLN